MALVVGADTRCQLPVVTERCILIVPLLVMLPLVMSDPPDCTVRLAPLFTVRLLHEAPTPDAATGSLVTSGMVTLSDAVGTALVLQFPAVLHAVEVVPVQVKAGLLS